MAGPLALCGEPIEAITITANLGGEPRARIRPIDFVAFEHMSDVTKHHDISGDLAHYGAWLKCWAVVMASACHSVLIGHVGSPSNTDENKDLRLCLHHSLGCFCQALGLFGALKQPADIVVIGYGVIAEKRLAGSAQLARRTNAVVLDNHRRVMGCHGVSSFLWNSSGNYAARWIVL
jgi:hypothetical protein